MGYMYVANKDMESSITERMAELGMENFQEYIDYLMGKDMKKGTGTVGRPKLEVSRDEGIRIRVTSEFKNSVVNRAEELGMSITEYIEYCCKKEMESK